jgi:curved DNA-binding protein CbpA
MAPSPASSPELLTRELISPAVYERFRERIAEDLLERPLAMAPEDHRGELAERLKEVGGADAYDVLGVPANVTVEQVTVAYIALARRVHPDHASPLGFPEAVLRLLFEHATRAYLVLSDPDRRRDYDREHGRRTVVAPVSAAELHETRRQAAQKRFERARVAMRSEQFHDVVELLRDAVCWDPRAELHALLGEAQSRNPHWRDEAVESFTEAVRLAPREVGYRLRLAQLTEEAGQLAESRKHYEEVLARFANHPEALAGLERIALAPAPRGSR